MTPGLCEKNLLMREFSLHSYYNLSGSKVLEKVDFSGNCELSCLPREGLP